MATLAKDKAERFLVSIIIHRSGMASFYVILLCGDVALNPGPMKWPCTVYGKSVKSNDRAFTGITVPVYVVEWCPHIISGRITFRLRYAVRYRWDDTEFESFDALPQKYHNTTIHCDT